MYFLLDASDPGLKTCKAQIVGAKKEAIELNIQPTCISKYS
jgi:hypothetical protein